MHLPSHRLKALAVTAGLSFWFFMGTSAAGWFTVEALAAFACALLAVTQIFSRKLAAGLEIFAVLNTKFVLGAVFVLLISVYGIFFRVLMIDLLYIKWRDTAAPTYWEPTDPGAKKRDKRQF